MSDGKISVITHDNRVILLIPGLLNGLGLTPYEAKEFKQGVEV